MDQPKRTTTSLTKAVHLSSPLPFPLYSSSPFFAEPMPQQGVYIHYQYANDIPLPLLPPPVFPCPFLPSIALHTPHKNPRNPLFHNPRRIRLHTRKPGECSSRRQQHRAITCQKRRCGIHRLDRAQRRRRGARLGLQIQHAARARRLRRGSDEAVGTIATPVTTPVAAVAPVVVVKGNRDGHGVLHDDGDVLCAPVVGAHLARHIAVAAVVLVAHVHDLGDDDDDGVLGRISTENMSGEVERLTTSWLRFR